MNKEEILKSIRKIDETIWSLTELKQMLYDSLANQIFRKNDMVIYEDDDRSTKSLFEKTEDGDVYLRYLSNVNKISCVCSSKNFVEHWKKVS